MKKDWMLTPEESHTAYYSKSNNPERRTALSLAQARKIVEEIEKHGHSSRDTHHFEIDMDFWEQLRIGGEMKDWMLTDGEIEQILEEAQRKYKIGDPRDTDIKALCKAQARKMREWLTGLCTEHHQVDPWDRYDCPECMEQFRKEVE